MIIYINFNVVGTTCYLCLNKSIYFPNFPPSYSFRDIGLFLVNIVKFTIEITCKTLVTEFLGRAKASAVARIYSRTLRSTPIELT